MSNESTSRLALTLAVVVVIFSSYQPVSAASPPEEYERIAQHLHDELDGEVVGYAFAIGPEADVTGSGGFARTSADGEPVAFSAETPMIVASVSKWISAIATMAILQDKGLTVEEPLGPYVPGDWNLSPSVSEITFAQLMNHTSGIRAFGNGLHPYASLEEFFTQSVDPNAVGSCGVPRNSANSAVIAPQSRDYCYSNYNSALLRVLLPKLANEPLLINGKVPGQAFDKAYERLVQRRVFSRLGIDASCNPDNDDYALSYIYPGNQPGKDWGESYERCAEGGWYLAATDMARLLGSIATRDGRIVEESATYSSFKQMRMLGLGIGRNKPDMMEKDGVLGDDPGVLSVSAMIYRPDSDDPIPIVLMINSTNSAIKIAHARPYIERALAAAGTNATNASVPSRPAR